MLPGQRATFTVDALGDAELEGVVRDLSPTAGSEFAVIQAGERDRKFRQGPVLTALVEQALANNNDVALAAARIREARAQEQVACRAASSYGNNSPTPKFTTSQ